MKNEETTPQINNAFVRMLQIHRDGQIISDLSEAITEVTENVIHTGRKGSITLKISVSPATAGNALVVDDEIKITLPKPEKDGSLFFANPETFELTRDNPSQLKFDLKSVEETEPEPLRKASSE